MATALAGGLRLRQPSVIPGFGPALGLTLAYLSLIVLVPLAAVYRLVFYARRGHADHAFQAGLIGKAATVAELFAILALVAGSRAVIPLALAAATLGLIAVGQYIVRASTHHEALEHSKA